MRFFGLLRACIFIAPLMVAQVRAVVNHPMVIIVPSYNNIKYYKRNIDMIIAQDKHYKNWAAIYIDDCSEDGTGDAVACYVKERGYEHKIFVVKNTQRRGALYNVYNVVHRCKDDKIIVICDGDDWFAHDKALWRINLAYQDPNVWLTYGQFIIHPSGKLGQCEALPEEIINNNEYRSYKWVTSHVRTYYAGLFKKIKKEDLMINGNFYPMATDFATMFPMLEMAGGRIAFIPDVIYVYNAVNPINLFRSAGGKQKAYGEHIRKMPHYQKIETWRS